MPRLMTVPATGREITDQGDSYAAQHRNHFPLTHFVVYTRFKQDGGGDVEEDSDHNSHDLVEVIFYASNGSIAEAITYIKPKRGHDGKDADVKKHIAPVEFILRQDAGQCKGRRNMV